MIDERDEILSTLSLYQAFATLIEIDTAVFCRSSNRCVLDLNGPVISELEYLGECCLFRFGQLEGV